MIIKKVLYIKEVKKMFFFTKNVFCIHVVEFEPNYNKKIYFFLVTITLLKLNCVQFTAMDSLF